MCTLHLVMSPVRHSTPVGGNNVIAPLYQFCEAGRGRGKLCIESKEQAVPHVQEPTLVLLKGDYWGGRVKGRWELGHSRQCSMGQEGDMSLVLRVLATESSTPATRGSSSDSLADNLIRSDEVLTATTTSGLHAPPPTHHVMSKGCYAPASHSKMQGRLRQALHSGFSSCVTHSLTQGVTHVRRTPMARNTRTLGTHDHHS
ncbi:hypothetical protein E2C01_055886 [Portunus trituberculatus]|uniref:Uncharacterized protein n=1 Tax=Portunus trituberculatus TaxID=210409 RepID=A0A5B7GWF3_PORTR|nr:hypothetical protein [Portunus trituberculatus]